VNRRQRIALWAGVIASVLLLEAQAVGRWIRAGTVAPQHESLCCSRRPTHPRREPGLPTAPILAAVALLTGAALVLFRSRAPSHQPRTEAEEQGSLTEHSLTEAGDGQQSVR